MTLIPYLKKIQQRTDLTVEEMHQAIDFIMSGNASEVQVAAFLMGLSVKGESVSEITGAATVLREKANPIAAPDGAIDCCGTGGDASGTVNISTAVSFVLAACDLPVAKHGNRAASSKSGTADCLEALGINLYLDRDVLEEALEEFNYCFLMAPAHHQAMKHVVPIRKELGCRTIFNLLGPLVNPAGTKHQLLGVYHRKWVRPMAETLHKLGSESAWVVHGSDGLDELTVTGPSCVAILKDGDISETTVSPEDFGLQQYSLDELKGGTAKDNADALMRMLEGGGGAYAAITIINAAAALLCAEKASSMVEAAGMANHAIQSGKALSVLNQYKAFSRDKKAEV